MLPSASDLDALALALGRGVEALPERMRAKVYLLLALVFRINYGAGDISAS
jgi:hypothetical protein